MEKLRKMVERELKTENIRLFLNEEQDKKESKKKRVAQEETVGE